MYTSRPKAPLCPVTVYLCEDTIDGIFTAIYRAWTDGTSHTDVRVRTNDTMSLFETYIFSESDGTLARKVQRSIIQKLSMIFMKPVIRRCFPMIIKKLPRCIAFYKKPSAAAVTF